MSDGERRIAELEEVIACQATYIATAAQTIDDLDLQCKFWRQAAEHAVKGWNDLEDRIEAAREVLDTIEGNVDAARELLGGADEWDEWAPPDPEVVAMIDSMMQGLKTDGEIDLGEGVKLRVVEDEVPIKRSEHDPDAHGGRYREPR